MRPLALRSCRAFRWYLMLRFPIEILAATARRSQQVTNANANASNARSNPIH
jgi:hypothetical protein